MKKITSLITCLSLGASLLQASSTETIIGRYYLAQKNLTYANSMFAQGSDAEAKTLKERIALEMPEYVKEGIHLIVVQSADGSLVVGDSHHYGSSENVFASDKIEQLIIELMYGVLNITEHTVIERWTGVYPVSNTFDALIEKVSPTMRVAVVSSGTGASTAFGLAKDNFDEWLG